MHAPGLGLRLLGLCAALAAGGSARADTPPPPPARFQHLTTSDGLGDPRVRAILQDRVGFLWVGTPDGLGRYDGLRFRTFRHDPSDPASLGPGMPDALLEDRRGGLWVGHFGGGLSRFDPSTERFRRFRHDPADPNSLSQDDVADLLEDREGALWVATNGGLNRLDPDTGHVIRYNHDPADPQSLSGNDVRCLQQDPAGALWVGTGDGGLNRLTVDPASGRMRFEHWRHDPRDARSLASDNVESLLVDRKGGLWVGTWGAGLFRYDPARDAFVPPAVGEAESQSDSLIQDLLEDHDGMVWAATWGSGLVRIDPATGRKTRYAADPDEPASLSHGNVNALFEDRGGLLWIGTGGGGLNALDLAGQPLTTFVLRGTGVRDVRAVLEDRGGRLWAGTAGGGLVQLDHSGHVIERHRHAPGDPASLADDNVLSLLEDREGTLWVGTMGGLDLFDREGRRFVHHRHDPASPNSLSNDIVSSLFEDGSGRLWVGTANGLDLFDRARGRFQRHHREAGTAGWQEADSVFGATEDSSGTLWVALRGGLARLDEAGGRLVAVPLLTGEADDKGYVWCIRRASSGAIWIGKGSALFELRPSGQGGSPSIQRHVPLPEGGLVTSIESGPDGTLWLGTTRGLVRYDPKPGRARRYDAEDGASSDGYNVGAAFRGSGGQLYFGATGGITVARPGDLHNGSAPPPVVFTGLRVGHTPVPVGSPLLPRALSGLAEVRVPHEERVLTVEFAALGFRAPRKNRYRYQLQGFDPEWNELPADRQEVTYTNLSPGRYLLRVRAANGDGAWNEQGASLGLHILPPWWGTWWFRLLAFGGLASALLAAHRARTWAVNTRNRMLELELRERRQEQEALAERARNEEALRRQQEHLAHASRVLTLGELAAAIAHELNQPLSAILSNAQAALMLHARPESAKSEVDDALGDISRDAARGGEIIRKLRDLVHRREPKREVLDVNQAIRGIEPLLRAGALEHGVVLDLDLAPGLPEAQGDVVQIQQVVLNLARNAVDAMRAVSLAERRSRLRTSREDGAVVVEVADNGPPLDAAAFDRLFLPFFSTKPDGLGMGLSISRSIVESHGGQIAAQRNPGGGLTVRFTLPLPLREAQGMGA